MNSVYDINVINVSGYVLLINVLPPMAININTNSSKNISRLIVRVKKVLAIILNVLKE